MKEFFVLPSERLYYTGPTEEVERVFKEISDLPNCPDTTNMSVEERISATNEYIRLLEQGTSFIIDRVCPKETEGWKSIVLHAYDHNHDPVGRVVLNYFNTARPSLDIKVLPMKQRQGYGYEMLKAIIDAAFEQFGYDHIEYDLLAYNEASRRLITKVGGKLVYKDERGESYHIAGR